MGVDVAASPATIATTLEATAPNVEALALAAGLVPGDAATIARAEEISSADVAALFAAPPSDLSAEAKGPDPIVGTVAADLDGVDDGAPPGGGAAAAEVVAIAADDAPPAPTLAPAAPAAAAAAAGGIVAPSSAPAPIAGATPFSASSSSAPSAAAAALDAAADAPPAPIPDTWEPHPMDPLRFVKYEIRQLLLARGSLSIAQLPEEYLKCYRKPLTTALKVLDSQYTPESARSGKPGGRARKSTLGAFLREHLMDVIEVRQRPHGQHVIVAAGGPLSTGQHVDGFGGAMRAPGVGGFSSGGGGGGGGAGAYAASPNATQTTEASIRALILQHEEQQRRQQEAHLAQLRLIFENASGGNALGGGNASVAAAAAAVGGDAGATLLNDTGPLINFAPVRDALRSASLLPGMSNNVNVAAAMNVGGGGGGATSSATRARFDFDPPPNADANANGWHSSVSPVPAANLLAMNHPTARANTIAAAAIGALRGAALLNPTVNDIPAENRIYVTWRVPSSEPALRVEDLWTYFSRFGRIAFCNPRPLRQSHATNVLRRNSSLSGAGYAFLGFSPPNGAEAVSRVLASPTHALRAAELRVKPWRDRELKPGEVASCAFGDGAFGAGGAHSGDFYFPHPDDSGTPVLATSSVAAPELPQPQSQPHGGDPHQGNPSQHSARVQRGGFDAAPLNAASSGSAAFNALAPAYTAAATHHHHQRQQQRQQQLQGHQRGHHQQRGLHQQQGHHGWDRRRGRDDARQRATSSHDEYGFVHAGSFDAAYDETALFGEGFFNDDAASASTRHRYHHHHHSPGGSSRFEDDALGFVSGELGGASPDAASSFRSGSSNLWASSAAFAVGGGSTASATATATATATFTPIDRRSSLDSAYSVPMKPSSSWSDAASSVWSQQQQPEHVDKVEDDVYGDWARESRLWGYK